MTKKKLKFIRDGELVCYAPKDYLLVIAEKLKIKFVEENDKHITFNIKGVR